MPNNVALSCVASPERSEWGIGTSFCAGKKCDKATSASEHCSALFFLIKNFNSFRVILIYIFFQCFFHSLTFFITFALSIYFIFPFYSFFALFLRNQISPLSPFLSYRVSPMLFVPIRHVSVDPANFLIVFL